jgi:hypothetical protein
VRDNMRRKLGEKTFRDVMVCYPLTHPGTACTTPTLAASPLPSMLSSRRTPGFRRTPPHLLGHHRLFG